MFPTTRRQFTALLIAVAAAYGYASEKYRTTQRNGYRHGKHNHRNPGAFGGKRTAKSHRALYLKAA